MKFVLILIGILVGILIVGVMGMVFLKFVVEVSWFYLLIFFYFGILYFEWLFILIMIFVFLIMMVELIGVFFVFGDIIGCKIEGDDLKCGYWVEGIVVIFGGLFSIFFYLMFFENVGVV